MIINKHDCFNILFDLKSKGIDTHKELDILMHSEENFIVPKIIMDILKEQQNPIICFYTRLNNKAHKLIKEILTCDNKPIANYIKIATSLITQSTITLEHDFTNNIEEQNNFIKLMGLKELSLGLSEYFTNGDYTLLVQAVKQNQLDVKSILE